ncbi:phosphatidylglycerol:prolipoprotein diacylglycerol transferase [Stella humosa]|uniref:Phosphatidylglycerol--prolipoprotein diacylglyceryl transferase n=1 Tax=Stella humosa TaxID=94 RepID=A0A3N1KZK9_9PROT|nr:prolipoprotein diacylglyceryl transferase [Stella humosa]ROP84617.1 phosphatidylglycerol:prolipoprotein diacylglycerol transferase [Stella humosa]BBK34137.1 prolipoprotein diacylglyceryl transferase [Stella humosa]
MVFAIPFPAIDPVLVQVGPFAIRWYALAYIAGIIIGWRYTLVLAQRGPKPATGPAVTARDMDDFIVWATLGIVLGGRLGYVLFYKPGYYLYNPLEALQVWHGGMSFHGGLVGVILAMLLFARRRGLEYWRLADIVAAATPIGLFFGRLANFVNGELFGRTSDVPWAMVFPHGGPLPRHPSQLYQAFFEGICVFAVLAVLEWVFRVRERPGTLAGAFLVSYGFARIVGELFREPDAHLGFLFLGVTMGQLLSLPMVLFGAWLIQRGRRAA